MKILSNRRFEVKRKAEIQAEKNKYSSIASVVKEIYFSWLFKSTIN